MSLRVLFAIHTARDPRTAVFMTVAARAEELRRRGHHVDIVAPEDLGIPRMSGLWPLWYAAAVAFRGRLSSYDLVVFHSHCAWAFERVRAFLPRARRVTTVITFHGLEPLYHEAAQQELARMHRHYKRPFRVLHTRVLVFLARFACRRADAVFCLNTAEREYLLRNGWCTPSRAVVVSNGVERALFSRRAHGGRATTLLFVAQWLPAKGTRYLIEAFRTAAGRDPALRLVCAGTGGDADAIVREFAPEIRDRVRVLPHVDRPALGDLLRRADAFVFPSLFEGASLALLEAMAASLAIVASPAGAAADLLRDGENALVVPFADAPALARAIERVSGDGELRDRLARAAHDAALTHEWSRSNNEYCAHLSEAVQRHACRSAEALQLL